MLTVDPYQSLVAARLLDFFDSRTLWHRRLWCSGIVLTLKELLEASEAVQAKVLTDSAVRQLSNTALGLMGPDPGIGSAERRSLLNRTLKSEIRFQGYEYCVLDNCICHIEPDYLLRWSRALRSGSSVGVERCARAIAAHLLDAGFSSDFLHRWWTFRVMYQPGKRDLADIVEEAHALLQGGLRTYNVLVAFEGAPHAASGLPAAVKNATQVSEWLTDRRFAVTRVRQGGGMILDVNARDPWSAVESAGELMHTFATRISIGTRKSFKVVDRVWVDGQAESFSLRRRRRGVEVRALHREDHLYSTGKLSIVDAAIELLEPLAVGAPGPAVAGAWAAIEASLTGPGDEERVLAGDRLAMLVAASLPRAELTVLAYKAFEDALPSVVKQILKATENRQRAEIVADAIRAKATLNFTDHSDNAAVARMTALLADPKTVIDDVQAHVRQAFRRLYRNRNLVLHWGRTNAVGLRACLRTAAPLVGAGIDRIAHAWFVDEVAPLLLVAKTSIKCHLLGGADGCDPLDLLT